jgi:hypothetical protein
VERAGSAVELRPAPKVRSAAHPQERQHSAAEGGTRDRVRSGRSSPCAARAPPCVRDRYPNGRRRSLPDGGTRVRLSGSGRQAPRARSEGDAPNTPPQGLLAGAFLQSLYISNVELERQRGHGSGRARRQDLPY